jgi:hypothetical protein
VISQSIPTGARCQVRNWAITMAPCIRATRRGAARVHAGG